MALQPLDEFKGFDWGEQIHGPTCVRYQLNMLGYGLAALRRELPPERAPAGRAGAGEPDRQGDRPAGVEVLAHAQPASATSTATPTRSSATTSCCRRYIAEQMNLYEAATGSTRFDEPGSLTFVWKDGRTFAYDHHSIVEAVRRNFEANQLGFFPCEPGWVFTACNTMGAQALKGHDTMHQTDALAGRRAAVAPRRRGGDAHAGRQPAPHPVEDRRAVVRHRRGARWRVLPHRDERVRRRGPRPRRARRTAGACAASTPRWPHSAIRSSTESSSSTWSRGPSATRSSPRPCRSGPDSSARRERSVRSRSPGRPCGGWRRRAAPAGAGPTVRSTPAFRHSASTCCMRWGTPLELRRARPARLRSPDRAGADRCAVGRRLGHRGAIRRRRRARSSR